MVDRYDEGGKAVVSLDRHFRAWRYGKGGGHDSWMRYRRVDFRGGRLEWLWVSRGWVGQDNVAASIDIFSSYVDMYRTRSFPSYVALAARARRVWNIHPFETGPATIVTVFIFPSFASRHRKDKGG